MDIPLIDPLMPFWGTLDRIILGELTRWFAKEPGASLWAWESDNLAMRAIWEQLTQVENLGYEI